MHTAQRLHERAEVVHAGIEAAHQEARDVHLRAREELEKAKATRKRTFGDAGNKRKSD